MRGRPRELRDRFAGRLRFGTAGLRGAVAAGPNRMNRAVVRAATAAVAGWLPGSASRAAGQPAASVVVGCDARHRSADFADEVAGVLAGADITVHVLPLPCPTPLLAFAVRHLAAAAGVMITASHNPAADNGYKLYLSDGAQVIPPVDAEVEQRIADLGPLTLIPVADAGSPLIIRHGDEVAQAYLDAVIAVAAPGGPGSPARAERRLHADARGGRGPHAAGHPAGGFRAARTWWRRRRNPTPTSRRSLSPTRRNRARSTWRWPTREASVPSWSWPATRTGTGSPSPCLSRRTGGGC